MQNGNKTKIPISEQNKSDLQENGGNKLDNALQALKAAFLFSRIGI